MYTPLCISSICAGKEKLKMITIPENINPDSIISIDEVNCIDAYKDTKVFTVASQISGDTIYTVIVANANTDEILSYQYFDRIQDAKNAALFIKQTLKSYSNGEPPPFVPNFGKKVS